METVNLLNANNEILKVEVIRYFNFNGNRYLLYSLNEVDENNYIKLYAVKISDFGLESVQIIDENEWNALVQQIKTIIKENKIGVAQVNDLNYKELESLKVNDERAFRFPNQLVEFLKANKKSFDEPNTTIELEEQPTIEPITINKIEEDSFNVVANENPVDTPLTTPLNQEFNTNEQFNYNQGAPEAFTSNQEINFQNNQVEDYQALYMNEKELTNTLKSEISELKEKLNKITEIVNK